ncbi:MAG TPA: N-methyl-L-tryptophan oxidase [Verrucomicrobiae bacterium]|jgi:sarcosine oxidase
MANDHDVIVAGLGAMGSAAAYHLATSGRRVLGLDRFRPPHDFGSSHGLTRIIREAYFEHPIYVPVVQRAYELWAELQKKSGRQLLRQTGGLMIGPRAGVVAGGAERSAKEHHLAHEILSAAELRRRFPVFVPTDEMVAVWEPRAGILFPELAIRTHLELAAQNGATLEFDEPVLRWEPLRDGVRVFTEKHSYTADRLLLSAGAWMRSLVPELTLPLTVERQILFWFEPRARAELFLPQRCPIHLWEYEPHRFFYGFPDLGDGVKVALHHQGEKAQPDTVRREVDDDEIKAMRELLRRFLPDAEGRLKSTAVCVYTNTPDEHFILDHHPLHPQVVMASPCSGHGFKFSSAIGEIAALLLNDRPVPFDLSLFALKRFGSQQ